MSNIQNNLNRYFEGGFKTQEYKQSDNTPLPDGDYYCEVEEANVKQTRNGKGVGCNVTFSILGSCKDGNYSNRKIWNWFNLQHENEVAQKIGNAEFAQLCEALGLNLIENSDELIGRGCIITVGLDKKDPERNVIKKFLASSPQKEKEHESPPESSSANPWG